MNTIDQKVIHHYYQKVLVIILKECGKRSNQLNETC